MFLYIDFTRDGENYYSGSWYKVPVKSIKNIEYVYDKSIDLKNKWIEIRLNFSKGNCFVGKSDNKFQGKNNVSYQLQNNTSIVMKLDMEFVETGMKKRVDKALIHLIKLYGGNATIKKEAF